jgi:hypothetical protein
MDLGEEKIMSGAGVGGAVTISPEVYESLESFLGGFAAAYCTALREPASAALLNQFFTDSFIVVNPNGVLSWKNDNSLPLSKGFEFYRSIGVRQARITALAFTFLDDLHSQAKARWEMAIQRTNGTDDVASFDVHYFLQSIEGRHRIFCMISDDEWRVWRDKGLLPAPPPSS